MTILAGPQSVRKADRDLQPQLIEDVLLCVSTTWYLGTWKDDIHRS
jgi:hypothetical protein